MQEKKLTIFQKLGNIITSNGIKVKEPQQLTQRYHVNNSELFKTTDKQAFDVAKTQAQQNKYISHLWSKVDNGLFQKSLVYEASRIASYSDFEAMENFPEIAASLDVFAEESTTLNSVGKMLNVYSDSPRVKGIIEDLLYNRLDAHTSLPMWVRNAPIRENSIIPLLDGTEVTIKDLSNKIKNGEEIWTYSIQKDTNAIVPGKIIWCDLTRKDSELYRVTLDDGTHIDTTADHQYMLRDGSYKKASELTEGTSLMPFYTTTSIEKQNKIVGYEKIYNPSSNRYRYTHRIVSNELLRDYHYENMIGEKFLTHHKNYIKKDNSPNNLERLTFGEHALLHERNSKHLEFYRNTPEVIKKRMAGIDRYLRSDTRKERLSKEMTGIYPKYFQEYNNSDLHSEHNTIRSEKMTKTWSNDEYKKNTKSLMTITINDEAFNYMVNLLQNSNHYIGINKLANILKADDEFIKLFSVGYKLRKSPLKAINSTTLNKMIKRKTKLNYFDFMLSIKPNIIINKEYLKAKAIFLGKTVKKVINHKVVSVIKLNEVSDVYCMEVVGPDGEHDRHNFPVCSKDNAGKHTRNGVFLANCKYGDNFIFLNIDDKNGVVGVKQLPNYEIERRESGSYGFVKDSISNNKTNKVKFYWARESIEFNSWQIAHFRLLGDDRKLPYGTSLLEKARRPWRQLLLSEDSMLANRVIRGGERRVFKIDVGNIDEQDVGPFIDAIANRFKRKIVTDPATGQYDLRYNQISQDEDIFIPTRKESATDISVLPGASNLSQIEDIEFIQKKLFTALRVPKTFIGYDDSTGDGKNLAFQDIRFTRTINRIQQSMLQELNKIIIIHLHLLGFEDDLDNFTVSFNNPSTQADILKIEQLQNKVNLFRDVVSDAGNGFGTMSWTRAKREILGWSDDEIKQDLLEQRMEKAAAFELENTNGVIKHTGMFDDVDRVYGDYSMALKGGAAPIEGEDGGSSDEAGGSPGGGLGGQFGGDEADNADVESDESDAGEEQTTNIEELPVDDNAETETTNESMKKNKKLIKENSVTPKPNVSSLNKLINNIHKNDIMNEKTKIYDKNIKINEGINTMIDEIDNMLTD